MHRSAGTGANGTLGEGGRRGRWVRRRTRSRPFCFLAAVRATKTQGLQVKMGPWLVGRTSMISFSRSCVDCRRGSEAELADPPGSRGRDDDDVLRRIDVGAAWVEASSAMAAVSRGGRP